MALSDAARWRSEDLGEARELDLPQGRLRYFERGRGEPVVFVHGLIVNANLWRKVVPEVARERRTVTLDLPLGSHELTLPGADLTPPAFADLIADAIEALGLEEATLVGNDTGGALSQIVVTRRPERIGRLVLTSCDAFENFPPKMFRPLIAAAKAPGGLLAAMAPLRARKLRRLPMAYGGLTKRPIDDRTSDSYVLPVIEDAGVRDDVVRALRGLDPRHTLDAAERLAGFDKPVTIAWSSEDKFFPPDHAERLAKLLPNAGLRWIEDSYTFSPEDQPGRVAQAVLAS